jgi:hypothetical protein
MGDFPYENQTTLYLTYQQDSGFNSGSVRTVRDKYDPHRVLGSIERLKRKWFSPAEKFRVGE